MYSNVIPLQAAIVAIFILVHLFSGNLRFLDVIPRSRWLSLAGGISIAYVFVHVLPELNRAQMDIGEKILSSFESHAYVAAAAGLTIFYGLERMAKIAAEKNAGNAESDETPTGPGVFWLHILSFAVYNILSGYLLIHREERDLRGLMFFASAMAVHFLITDYGLRKDHKNSYRRIGRWLLAVAIVAGWIVGLSFSLSRAAIGLLFAFLAGGVILNVLKEELPEERKSQFWPFALGVAGYTVVLLLL